MPKQIDALKRALDGENLAIIDDEKRIIEFSCASEIRYHRWWYDEILGLDSGECDLARLNNGAPLMKNHKEGIGAVVKAWIADKRLHAQVQLSSRDSLADFWSDIKAGLIKNVSIGYNVRKIKLIEENEDSDVYRVTDWLPLEISILDIPPADDSVGIGRSDVEHFIRSKGGEMPKPKQSGAADGDQQPADEPLTRDNGNQEQDSTALSREDNQQRCADIRSLFVVFPDLPEKEQQRCLDDSAVSVEQARAIVETHYRKKQNTTPVGTEGDMSHRDADVTVDARDKFKKGAEQALLDRAGYSKKVDRGNELLGYSLREMCRHSLQIANLDTGGNAQAMIGRAFTTSDFPHILEAIANKSLMEGYQGRSHTYEAWTIKGNLSDFKVNKRVGLTGFERFKKLREAGERKAGTIGEYFENIQLATFAMAFGLSRETIINDDLSAFTEIPFNIGEAAKLTIAIEVYDYLNSNPNLADGSPLFSVARKNLQTGSPIDKDSLKAMKSGLANQKLHDKGDVLGIRPKHLIVPEVMEWEADAWMLEPKIQLAGEANTERRNPAYKMAEVVAESLLNERNDKAWYMAAERSTEIAYLDGIDEPTIEQKTGWTTDGIEMEAFIDFGVGCRDFRRIRKNPGV